jgi:hypothetical protein
MLVKISFSCFFYLPVKGFEAESKASILSKRLLVFLPTKAEKENYTKAFA